MSLRRRGEELGVGIIIGEAGGTGPLHELCKAHDSRAREGPRLRCSTYLCTWIPTVGPLRGRGPRPCSLPWPPPPCNTVWSPTRAHFLPCPFHVAYPTVHSMYAADSPVAPPACLTAAVQHSLMSVVLPCPASQLPATRFFTRETHLQSSARTSVPQHTHVVSRFWAHVGEVLALTAAHDRFTQARSTASSCTIVHASGCTNDRCRMHAGHCWRQTPLPAQHCWRQVRVIGAAPFLSCMATPWLQHQPL